MFFFISSISIGSSIEQNATNDVDEAKQEIGVTVFEENLETKIRL